MLMVLVLCGCERTFEDRLSDAVVRVKRCSTLNEVERAFGAEGYDVERWTNAAGEHGLTITKKWN